MELTIYFKFDCYIDLDFQVDYSLDIIINKERPKYELHKDDVEAISKPNIMSSAFDLFGTKEEEEEEEEENS